MSTIKELFKSKWLTVNEKTLDNGGKYLFTSSEWCNSEAVSILPYKHAVVDGLKQPLFLGRYELCPAHSDNIELGAIMGGCDHVGEEPVVTAWRELQEEGGIKVPIENIVYLGTSRPTKSSDMIMHLFAVDVDKEHEEVEATGDGTLVEEGGYSKWISMDEMIFAKEPLLQTMYLRLQQTGGLEV